jgi:galactokinase
MTGAGMGGCAVALIRAEEVDSFTSDVAACYEAATGLAPNVYVSPPMRGAELQKLA